MAKTNKGAVKAPEPAQDTPEARDVSQDVREQEAVPGAVEAPPAPPEIIGPENETELAGCLEDTVAEGLLQAYAVKPEGGLRLREEPDLKSPVLATLPCGAGVFAEAGPAEAGWRQVYTGRLSGWMMARHLEALEYSTELATHGAD